LAKNFAKKSFHEPKSIFFFKIFRYRYKNAEFDAELELVEKAAKIFPRRKL
jgi:hypothetical protein